jgi:outer membrane protein OmpA-like peptidoglycan-associated protein
MRPRRSTSRSTSLLLMPLTAVALAAGCRLPGPSRGDQPATVVSLPPVAPSALAICLPATSDAGEPAAVSNLLAAVVQPNLHLAVLSGSSVLWQGTTPATSGPRRLPAGPSKPRHPTEYQSKRYQQKEGSYLKTVNVARHELTVDARASLTGWLARQETALASVRVPRRSSAPGSCVAAAVAGFSSLDQARVDLGPRRVVVVLVADAELGIGGRSTATGVAAGGGLQRATVIGSNASGTVADLADTRGRLLAAGAGRAVLLTAAASAVLPRVVESALHTAPSDPLPATVLFPLGSDYLDATAGRVLTDELAGIHALPNASITINGYADSLGVAAANVALSQRRATAVRDWLVAHGVDPRRMAYVGRGSSDPLVPLRPGGEPANRAVVVIIDPP